MSEEKKEPQDFELWGNNEAKCPHCGYEHDCSHEFFGESDPEEIEVDCSECEKPFMLEREFSVSYSTRKKKENDTSTEEK